MYYIFILIGEIKEEPTKRFSQDKKTHFMLYFKGRSSLVRNLFIRMRRILFGNT
jgi:hypothetical protein